MLTDLLLGMGWTPIASGWFQLGAAGAIAFLIVLLFGRPFINWMKRIQGAGQPISENITKTHRAKAGTPTMGGVLILAAVFVASLLFMPMSSDVGWIALSSLLMFGIIGFADDYKKVSSQATGASNGLSRGMRLATEGVCVIILAYFINRTMPAYVPSLSLTLPFDITWQLGLFYYVFAYFVITGSANATNITDGLDGLLSKTYLPVLAVLIVALYGATRIGFMDTVLFLPETSGLYAVLGAMLGAVLGFLWYNAKPASIFMGDVGSLALGGFMGTVAMLLKSEIILAVAAGILVLILLSSFIQTTVYKLTKKNGHGKRVFLRAPLHHHFEELGWPETRIVERFFIASILFSGLALMILKFA